MIAVYRFIPDSLALVDGTPTETMNKIGNLLSSRDDIRDFKSERGDAAIA
eukprot:CAMPEP_0178867108 /NCGR_PEP_ID=MMETSP0747-20121128/5296_1 /TAXON_ID=913974 /ORGANISM="Nitzschia punctata, Strain CCMP561" /LENGTH=49 /DNA_ID= /DNA_START= /DNA_END= /DNA_ORIENTATION=